MVYTIADYVIQRLKEQGIDTLFGVPSVYCAGLYAAAETATRFDAIVTSSDLEAGYAADGYARVRGLGAVACSYGPGTLSLVNAIAGAYIERSPIVVINGGPSRQNIADQQRTGIVFSHSAGFPHTDMEVLREVTAFCERVEGASAAPARIDQAIRTAIVHKHPVYIEIPQAVLAAPCAAPASGLDLMVQPGAAVAVANAIIQALSTATAPLLFVGVEVQRYGLGAQVQSIINKLNIRWSTTLLERTTLLEQHAKFLGVFNGDKALPVVRNAVSSSDLIISLGAVFGSGHARIMIPKHSKIIRVWDGNAYIKGGPAQAVSLSALIDELDRRTLTACAEVTADTRDDGGVDGSEAAWDGDRDEQLVVGDAPSPRSDPSVAAAGGMTYDALFQEIEKVVGTDPAWMLIADTFLGIYPAARIKIAGQDSFMANAVWASIGHAVAAGAGVAAAKRKRPIIVCGDGGFQMTAQSLSTMAKLGRNAITVVVDNGLYGYEQYLLRRSYYTGSEKPVPYAVIGQWDYEALARSMGITQVAKATTQAQLTAALATAKAFSGPSFIQAMVDPKSLPAGL
ncbi:thiamine pyrophosphate-binding protein (plasmid) [Rhizobium ruizarguesonis]|nr:thiamine pyrophosphate-binding protein [Rhizobium ruizarguesonis]